MTDPRRSLAVISVDKPFTKRQRQRLASQTALGHRPINNWQDGDLPAPWAEGDLLLLPVGIGNDRLYGMGAGYFVVSCAFSIDEGDAWYFRVTNHNDRGSDRLHVACAERSTWDKDCDWMAGFKLVDTADPDGLEEREAMLARGWTFKPRPNLRAQLDDAVPHAQAMEHDRDEARLERDEALHSRDVACMELADWKEHADEVRRLGQALADALDGFVFWHGSGGPARAAIAAWREHQERDP